MPPAKGKKARVTQGLQAVESLQAVVLADSFDQRFDPITLELPRVSLP